MENSELKEKIRKNIKEEIAVSNIRKEFDMKSKKNKKIIYWLTSCVAVFILGFGIIIGTSKLNNNQIQNNPYEIADLQSNKLNKNEALEIKLNINKIKKMSATSLDADVETIEIEELPNKFEFIKNIQIPEEYKIESSYNIYTRSDINKSEYDVLHDYVFNYRKDSMNKIIIAFSEIEKPLRDYYIDVGDKVSKLGDIELIISQYKDMYIVTFNFKDIYFDIETTGITENELLKLLQSILTENNKNLIVEDKDINIKEQSKDIKSTNYPDYYAGKYVDNNGNNVILLCEDNETNRKEICNLLGITEEKTIFKTAKYSYNYLTDLQNKISKKMIDKEFTFVTTSVVMEDNNNIKVTVISSDENDLNKIKVLDTIGGAIEIQYNENGMSKTELLVEKE
ncbi:MAG: hypothetical protein HFJ45_00105 [Clostridia bacterium]|nr:hypothetical protein [Clostridia bacterium]